MQHANVVLKKALPTKLPTNSGTRENVNGEYCLPNASAAFDKSNHFVSL